MTDVDAFLAMLNRTGITYDVQRDVDGSVGGPKYPPRATQIRIGSVHLWFCTDDAVTFHGAQKAGALFDVFYCRVLAVPALPNAVSVNGPAHPPE